MTPGTGYPAAVVQLVRETDLNAPAPCIPHVGESIALLLPVIHLFLFKNALFGHFRCVGGLFVTLTG